MNQNIEILNEKPFYVPENGARNILDAYWNAIYIDKDLREKISSLPKEESSIIQVNVAKVVNESVDYNDIILTQSEIDNACYYLGHEFRKYSWDIHFIFKAEDVFCIAKVQYNEPDYRTVLIETIDKTKGIPSKIIVVVPLK